MPSDKTQLEVILKTTADLITHYRALIPSSITFVRLTLRGLIKFKARTIKFCFPSVQNWA